MSMCCFEMFLRHLEMWEALGDGMEVWKIRRMPMSLAPWGNLRVGPLDR